MQELEKDMNAVPAPESGPEIVAEGTVDSTPSGEEQLREAVLKIHSKGHWRVLLAPFPARNSHGHTPAGTFLLSVT